MSSRAMCVLGSLALAAVLIGPMGCTNPQIGGNDMYVATTARTYSEARAFYLSDPLELGPTGVRPDMRQLLAPFQANELVEKALALNAANTPIAPGAPSTPQSRTTSNTAPAAAMATGAQTSGCCASPARAPAYEPPAPTLQLPKLVRHTNPLTVIVNKVVTPGGSGTRDVAVVLDIAIKEANEPIAPLVVWYQRDVPAGKELAFDNLVVEVQEHWDAKFPPYFRLRLIDIKKEDNQSTLSLIGGVQKLANSLSTIIPSPAMPGVALGIEAAKQILGHQCNVVLMDYTVQFYAGDTKDQTGGADLGYLATGHWIAIGINRSQDSEFWRQNLYYDQRTMRVYSAEDLRRLLAIEDSRAARAYGSQDSVVPTGLEGLGTFRPRIDAPIVLMTVSTASTAAPKIAHERSKKLLELLQEDSASMDFDQLSTNLQSLSSSLNAYIARRRVERQQTYEGMATVMEILSRHKAASNPSASASERVFKLNDSDVSSLLLFLNEQTGQTDKHGVDAWLDWWEKGDASSNQHAGKTGSYQKVGDKLIWKVP